MYIGMFGAPIFEHFEENPNAVANRKFGDQMLENSRSASMARLQIAGKRAAEEQQKQMMQDRSIQLRAKSSVPLADPEKRVAVLYQQENYKDPQITLAVKDLERYIQDVAVVKSIRLEPGYRLNIEWSQAGGITAVNITQSQPICDYQNVGVTVRVGISAHAAELR